MKILIVNGYSKTPKGKEAFAKYQELIQETFRNQRDFIDTNYEFIIRHRDDLDEFLYELDSAYVRKSGAKSFDHLDLIFIEGEASLLPWAPAAQKMLILLRMCLRTRKFIFASCFAMQALAFLTATNIEKGINVINGNGKGGKIGDILKLEYNPVDLRPNDYFLDNVTGDLYAFSYETNEWIPKFNVGLHYVKAAEAYDSLGKFIIKTPQYKPKNLKDNNNYLSKHTEDYCYLKKIYLQHWAVSGVESEFVVPTKNSWDIHQFNFVNPKKTFVVLAESKSCPQIIYFDDFCVGTLFTISKRYPPTFQIMKNFVISKLKEIKSMGKEQMISIEKASEQNRTINDFFNFASPTTHKEGEKSLRFDDGPRRITIMGGEKLNSRATTTAGSNRAKSGSGFFHSGFAFSHHDGPPLIVENNTVRTAMSVKINEKRQNSTGKIKFTTGSDGFKSPERPMSGTSNDVIAIHNFMQKKLENNLERRGSFSQFMDEDNPTQPTQATTLASPERRGGILKGTKSHDALFKKSKAEVAQMLYPEVSKELIEDEPFWIPGQMSQGKFVMTKHSKDAKKVITLNTSYSSKFYSTYNKFKDLNLDECRQKPMVRTSGIYFTDQEMYRKEQKEAAKSSLGPDHFAFKAKGEKPNFIPNYVTLSYSKPALIHNFRETKKEKWLAGDMKVL